MAAMWFIILLATFLTTTGLPVTDLDADITEVTPNFEDIERDANVLTYTSNFKNMMAEYVKLQHNNLTVDDMETVKVTLEVFLQDFAKDLHDILISKKIEEKEVINDGIPDATFDEIKRGIKIELSDASDEIADQIVYKLRKNLFNTRKKLDRIICNC
ncbi:uncharacterized protein LOC119838546 [Zerene cesonia]|uniref:uncharacterized protein LOC119838546 n=1 Tax=Zerene cesonia TaxID=33412 RepID=UPI0018E55689|nr:uncharacterized protein LOC119838546 [Zerene cesonia]